MTQPDRETPHPLGDLAEMIASALTGHYQGRWPDHATLESFVRRLLLRSPVLAEMARLPAILAAGRPGVPDGFLPPALPPAEREVLRHEGTVEAAATRLGWSRWAVRFAIDRYGIDWPPACPRAAAGPCNPPDQREADEPGRTEQHPDLPPEPIPHFIHDGVTDEPEENIGQAGAELRSDPKDDEVALTYDDPPGVEFWADEGDAVVRYALRWSPDDPVWGWTLESRGEDCDEFRTLKDVSERFSQVWPTLEDFKADEEPYHVDRLIEVVARAAGVDLAAAVAAQERDRHEGAQLGAQAMGYGEIDQEQDLAVTTRDEDFEPRSVETDGDDQEGEGHG